MSERKRAPRNRTITLDETERDGLQARLKELSEVDAGTIDATIIGDCLEVAVRLAPESVDMLFLDPPYNLNKSFGKRSFAKKPVAQYTEWLGGVLDALLPTVKNTGTVYICGDWHTSISIFATASERLHVRNRITWEREKGRGARTNWKNSSEDIWFCTVSDSYTFNVAEVKIRRKVIAPYRNGDGTPKDWQEGKEGNFRDTHPSNLWTDITVPFWSMPENTDHPTQKSEKLVAKLILASTNPGDLVLDPFLGSGTTSVVARKLDRRFLGIECDREYALLAEKRLELATSDTEVQGYSEGVFWERNSLNSMNGQARMAGQPDEESHRPI
ncbi:MAG: site-specific DNA-methyltransferase [Boseongicola sp. SB0662_bin_57]|nr:site-specific DNA-methyltransferase [Boseongicola sp. SB0662_bin_57]